MPGGNFGWLSSHPLYEAYLGLEAPAKTWRSAGDDCQVEECKIFSDEGDPLMVPEAEAEAWWKEVEPELDNEWQSEKAAAKRWIDAAKILRGIKIAVKSMFYWYIRKL